MDGVALNAPVISAHGVVGRVIAVGPQAARVQILLDSRAASGVRIERSRITGVVDGAGGLRRRRGRATSTSCTCPCSRTSWWGTWW